MRGPVQRAQERACGDGGIRGAQRPGPDAGGDQRTNAAFVLVALGHDPHPQHGWQGVDFEMGGRALDLVDQAQDVGDGEIADAGGQRATIAPRGRQRVEQPIGGPVLAEEQQLVLASEIVIEIARRKVGGDADVAHAGRREAAIAEDARRRPHDLDAPGVGSFRTAVRKLNHGSSVAE